MINSYNSVSRSYYPLARLAYGNSLKKIKLSHLDQLPKSGKLLYIGGGNAEILSTIQQIRPQLSVDFVEASSQMIVQAKKNADPHTQVNFIHSDHLPEGQVYDAIFAAFFLDCFSSDQIRQWYRKFIASSSVKAVIIITDFYQPKGLRQKLMLKLAIVFFRLFTSQTVDQLAPVFDIAKEEDLKHLKTRLLSNTLLRSSLFVKS